MSYPRLSHVDDNYTTAAAMHIESKTAELQQQPTQSEPAVTREPANCQFKVRATHAYKAEDEDELSFDAGDLIFVVPYDDPDEQVSDCVQCDSCAGRRLADGHQGVDGCQGRLPAQLYQDAVTAVISTICIRPIKRAQSLTS